MIEDYSQHRVKHIVGWIYSSTMPVAYSICASCHHAKWILRMDKLASYCCSVLAQADKPAAHPMLPGLANPRQPNIPLNCINCNLVNPQITGGWLQLLSSISQLYLGCHQRPSQQQNRALYPQNARPWLHSESSETNSKNIKSQKKSWLVSYFHSKYVYISSSLPLATPSLLCPMEVFEAMCYIWNCHVRVRSGQYTMDCRQLQRKILESCFWSIWKTLNLFHILLIGYG